VHLGQVVLRYRENRVSRIAKKSRRTTRTRGKVLDRPRCDLSCDWL
jgi:hypothetical protein